MGTIRPGDIKYKDQNGDGIIDQNDAVEIGNWSPRLSYGLSLGINYKNFSLFAIGGGQMGSDMTLGGSYFWMDGNDKYSVEALNRWTPERASTATLPRLSSGANTNSYRTSTFWLQSANAFSLNHVQLTYTFNDTFLNNLKIMKGASIYLRGQDLLLVGNQAERRLINVFGPPNMSRYALGVRMNF